MVTELFFNAVFGVLEFVLGAVPVLTFPDTVIGSLAGLLEVLSYTATFMPLSAISACIGIWLSINIFDFGFQVLLFVIKKIPGVS